MRLYSIRVVKAIKENSSLEKNCFSMFKCSAILCRRYSWLPFPMYTGDRADQSCSDSQRGKRVRRWVSRHFPAPTQRFRPCTRTSFGDSESARPSASRSTPESRRADRRSLLESSATPRGLKRSRLHTERRVRSWKKTVDRQKLCTRQRADIHLGLAS